MSSSSAACVSPPKPWEQASSYNSGTGPSNIPLNPITLSNNYISNSKGTNLQPPPPPPLLAAPPNSMPAASFGWPSTNQNEPYPFQRGNYYGPTGAYGGYNNYSSYYRPYAQNIPSPGTNFLSSIELGTRPLFDTMNQLMNALNQLAVFVDSSSYAIWSSIGAFATIRAAVSAFKNTYLKRLHLFIRRCYEYIRSSKKKQAIFIFCLISALAACKSLSDWIGKLTIEPTIEIPAKDPTAFNAESEVCFASAQHAFISSDPSIYLSLSPGDVVMISKDHLPVLDDSRPTWIVGRLKDGSTGYVPSNYLIHVP